MSDVRKSVALRCFLWVIAMFFVFVAAQIGNAALDWLPIWVASQGKEHHTVEGAVFLAVVGTAIWRWLSRRVWIGSLPSSDARAALRKDGQ